MIQNVFWFFYKFIENDKKLYVIINVGDFIKNLASKRFTILIKQEHKEYIMSADRNNSDGEGPKDLIEF